MSLKAQGLAAAVWKQNFPQVALVAKVQALAVGGESESPKGRYRNDLLFGACRDGDEDDILRNWHKSGSIHSMAIESAAIGPRQHVIDRARYCTERRERSLRAEHFDARDTLGGLVVFFDYGPSEPSIGKKKQ